MFALACNTVEATQVAQPIPTIDPTAMVATRVANISEKANFYLTPENWNTVPHACHQSMVRITFLGSDGDTSLGSGSLINKVQMIKDGQAVWVYFLYTAHHVTTSKVTGNDLNHSVNIYADDVEHNFGYFGNYQVWDDHLNLLDISIISVIGYDDLSTIVPQPVSNIVSGQNIKKGTDFFFSFDYPEPNYAKQYTISVVDGIGQENSYRYANLRQIDGYSSINRGSSGGALCNQNGQLIGVVRGGYFVTDDLNSAELNPDNIQNQVNQVIDQTINTLENNGFAKP
jgi:hypothetical protein